MTDRVRPVRLQRSRKAGSDLQAQSRAINGLPAVCVDRSTRWGNAWRVGDYVPRRRKSAGGMTQAEAVERYRKTMGALDSGLIVRELRARNLACWCRLCPAHAVAGLPFDEECADCAPCHSVPLGRAANRFICDAPPECPDSESGGGAS